MGRISCCPTSQAESLVVGQSQRLTSFWVETDEASRNEADMWMNKYREQMIGEAVIGTDTIEHWNRINPSEEFLQFLLDFTDEAQWRRNVPVEEEELV